MERVLIVGIDTVVGANLAAQLAHKFHVTGLSTGEEIAIEGCETATANIADAQSARQAIALYRPDQILLAQAAGDSSWHHTSVAEIQQAASATLAWIEATRTSGKRLTLISSDGVFTGPWMFHTESCDSFCPASEAQTLRTLEKAALKDSANSLVVRTHPYGWSPQLAGGWIDEMLAALEADQAPIFDCVAHSTPILATDLADVLGSAWNAGLTGIYHIAGAERTNPHRFACALARVFDLAPPQAIWLAPTELAPTGFARGECSLHTRSIRRALGIGLPMLIEGLERLRGQHDEGFDRRFGRSRRFAASKVA
ncbi:MAG TPA: sugar nucleotide-binding protein [Planctomycetaceae bacterium]|nr:sugar nucleotide-binding protein [Planctomycetaceae bacterium]